MGNKSGIMPLSVRIVDRIWSDISSRRGLSQELDQIDEDIQEEMQQTWRAIIDEELGRVPAH